MPHDLRTASDTGVGVRGAVTRGYGEQLLPLEITRLMMARLEMARLEMARLEMQPSVAWVIVSSGSRGSRASDLAA
jgi:hypothetical protein